MNTKTTDLLHMIQETSEKCKILYYKNLRHFITLLQSKSYTSGIIL